MKPELKAVSPDSSEAHKPIKELRANLVLAIQAEKDAKQARIEIEKDILDHPESTELKEGANHISGLNIQCGLTRKWDQNKLSVIVTKVKPEYWPFSIEFKEVRSDSKMLEKNFPDLWELISDALTLTPKKAAIKPE